jgi:hypothetical protein
MAQGSAMSITTEFKSDLRAAKKVWLPWHILLILGIACLVVVIVADRFGRLNMALPAYNCAVVFGFVIYLKSAGADRYGMGLSCGARLGS